MKKLLNLRRRGILHYSINVNIIDMTGVILVLCRQCWWYQSITVDMQTVAEPA
ncbi:unnamed protein product [Brassica rapa]|uniref:Uncharacterized protein n=2 Tax=Brassica TaxID=3705 RepID=A0A8D9GI13_BRACM|nr:unnamed protein product [Brassica napus]CAG7880993.1 unnamed protein product [Brassica rapa]